MRIAKSGNNLEQRRIDDQVTLRRGVEERRLQGEKTMIPDRLDPIGLTEVKIFKPVAGGDLFDLQGFESLITGVEDTFVDRAGEKDKVAQRDQQHNIHDKIVFVELLKRSGGGHGLPDANIGPVNRSDGTRR